MKNLDKIPQIKRMAQKFGTPFKDLELDTQGDGGTFTYIVGGEEHRRWYANADRGILLEIENLRNLLMIEI